MTLKKDLNNKIVLSKIDKKILCILEKDARTAITSIAKQMHISRSIAEYHLRKLEEKKIIKGYFCLLDPSQFGLTVWKLWLSTRFESNFAREIFFLDLESDQRIWWYAECVGKFDVVLCILAKTPHMCNQFVIELQKKYGKNIQNSDLLINVSFEYFTRGFLMGKSSTRIEHIFQQDPVEKKISSDERKLLYLLGKNSRASLIEIARTLHKNVKTIKNNILHLKKDGIILYFRPALDLTIVGYEFYKVLLYLHNGGIATKSIATFCENEQNVTAVISCVGPWQVELEVEVASYRDLSLLLKKLRDIFPQIIKSYETLLVVREGKYNLDLANKMDFI